MFVPFLNVSGNVYNVTRYLDFHPGGEEELMRGVGSDATDLFNQVHAWVNYESMLDKCLVGKLAHAPGSNSPKKAPLEGNMAPSKKCKWLNFLRCILYISNCGCQSSK